MNNYKSMDESSVPEPDVYELNTVTHNISSSSKPPPKKQRTLDYLISNSAKRKQQSPNPMSIIIELIVNVTDLPIVNGKFNDFSDNGIRMPV